MKKIILIIAVVVCTSAAYANDTPNVNEKVLKAFEQTFKNPTDVNWYEYETYYEVSFKQSEIQSRVRYDAEGNILGTTRYYAGEKLPPHILGKLKKKYTNRSIYYVTEISSEEGITYYVSMEDDKHWYTVTSDADGMLTQTEKFKKADQK